MRLFILERTPLACVGALADPPRAGDVVAWLRVGQDPTGVAAAALARSGVRVIDAERLIDRTTTETIDALGAAYLAQWFMEGGHEIGRLGPLSLGKSYGLEFARQANPRHLIRTGEIIRRLMAGHPEAETVFADFADGESVFRVRPDYQPMARIARHVAQCLGRPLRLVASPEPLPPALVRGKKNGWRIIVRSFLGGLRPAWIRARLHARRLCAQDQPCFYVFIGRGLDLVAARLAAAGRIRVVASALGIEGAAALRYDHLFALPRISDVLGALRLIRHARRLATSPDHAGALTVNGVAYGPIVARAFAALLRSELWPFLVVLAQTRKLQREVNYSALLVNGAGNEPMGISVALTAESACKVYLVSHGMDVHRIAIFCPVVDNPHVMHLVHGDDHRHDYRLYLPPSVPTRRHLIGSPVTALMNPVRGRRSPVHRRRLLILAFGHLDFWNAARIRACDQYFAEVFKVAAALLKEGWSVTCRPHPTHPQDLERRIASDLGIVDAVRWGDDSDFTEVLVAHDVVVSSLSSAFYQALYAGWPTIFYEPDYLPEKGLANLETDPMLTGLVTARDIDRPVTNDPAVLERLIRETLDPMSPTSRFPEKFATVYARRFIGPRAADADAAIAEFIERDFFSKDGIESVDEDARAAMAS